MTQQIANWNVLRTRVSEAVTAEAEAQEELRTFVEKHRADHPLSPAACNALRDAVRNGTPLCCDAGRKFLATVVDPIWAEVINDWAYDSLSCRGHGDREDHLLRLNDFLLGDDFILGDS